MKPLWTLRMNWLVLSAWPRRGLDIFFVVSLNSFSLSPSSTLGAFMRMFIMAIVAHALSTVWVFVSQCVLYQQYATCLVREPHIVSVGLLIDLPVFLLVLEQEYESVDRLPASH